MAEGESTVCSTVPSNPPCLDNHDALPKVLEGDSEARRRVQVPKEILQHIGGIVGPRAKPTQHTQSDPALHGRNGAKHTLHLDAADKLSKQTNSKQVEEMSLRSAATAGVVVVG